MVDYCEGKGPPPRALVEAFHAKRWGLPEGGGTLDQPAGLITRMTVALNVYEQWSSYLDAETQGRPVEYRRRMSAQTRRWLDDILRGKLARDSAK